MKSLVVLSSLLASILLLQTQDAIPDIKLATKVDLPTAAGPVAIAASDLDGDNDNDLVTVNNSHTVSVIKNNGDGNFAFHVDYATGINPSSVAIEDFDKDGDKDLAVANFGFDTNPGNTVSILLNNGDGTFPNRIDYLTGMRPYSLVAGDFDADGNLDIATTSMFSNTVSVLKNNGDGTFCQ